MARKIHLITRSITSTVATVIAHDVETEETKNVQLAVSRTYKTDNELLKVLREKYETDTFKIACVVDSFVTVEKYGMTEEDFISNAEIITKKSKDSEDDSEDEEDYDEADEEELEEEN